ncbi:MAG: response regulator transcription factor [Cyclobacteriaceae bacterium]
MSSRKKILLVDDHQILLDGIKSLLEDHPYYDAVADADDAESALRMLKLHPFDILITDLNLPGKSGLDLVSEVRKSNADIKIIALSMIDEEHVIKDVLKAGVNGYILKKATHDDLVRALDKVMEDKVFLSDEISELLVNNLKNPTPESMLTERELEILRLIVQEYTNKRIAEALFISERTVETHRKNLFRKTGAESLVGLIKFALENKLV